ncbi:MAG: hypothetical protein QG608_486, partial [Actinomycetota bacterium]|nr:hypothetical protein [Actinomycetota bacterium]
MPGVGNTDPSPTMVRIFRAILSPTPGIEVRPAARGWASKRASMSAARRARSAWTSHSFPHPHPPPPPPALTPALTPGYPHLKWEMAVVQVRKAAIS